MQVPHSSRGADLPSNIDSDAVDLDPFATASPPNVSQQSVRQPSCPCSVAMHRLMGTNGELTLQVSYPIPFKVWSLLTLATSVSWIVNFFTKVLPEATENSQGACEFNNEQLRQNSIVLFSYFVCFAVVRIFILFPGVAARVAEIQIGNLGFWRMYALHFVLHGPLYIFGIGAILFGLQYLTSPACEDEDASHTFHQNLGWFAGYSIVVFVFCLIFAYGHGKLISSSARYDRETKRRAPPGTLRNLLTFTFNEDCADQFNEEGGRFSEQCPICLMDWEEGDVIKVTACEHAFHEDCLGEWLKQERTCALCRQDIITCSGRSVADIPRRSSRSRQTSAIVEQSQEALDDRGNSTLSINVEEESTATSVTFEPAAQNIRPSPRWMPQRHQLNLEDTIPLPWVEVASLPPMESIAELDDIIDNPIRLEGNASRIKGRRLLIDLLSVDGKARDSDFAFSLTKPVALRVQALDRVEEMDESVIDCSGDASNEDGHVMQEHA